MEIDVKKYKRKKVKKPGKNLGFDFVFGGKVSDKLKMIMYRELKVMLKSGVTLEEAFSLLISQYKNKKIILGLKKIREELLKGKTLFFSISQVKFFTPFEINSLSIGEQTKTLPRVLEELEMFFEKKNKLKSQIKTVLTYPAFVISITLGVLVFMLRNVVPMFRKVFRQFNSDLPSLTKKIIYVSDNFSFFLLIIIGVCAFVFLFYIKFRDSDKFRRITSNGVLKTPFIGSMVKSIYLSRFCNAMGLLLGANVSIVESLTLIKEMIMFYPIESSIDDIKKEIVKGKSLTNSLKKHTFYDNRMTSMIKISEEVNELEDMFNYLASLYSEEVEIKSKRIGVIIEPIIIIVIGSLVGVILIAMYLPMFDLSKILNSN
ncbi:type IV pilus assembly protein PilC [Tenacibaculum sp. MAR_2009_124]|uniref:type II secretion system F family protein n=1 Tax=Tenacibaculum sp. MAR_2009_124 TaxID=1250059 RepID=UPI0008958687|nr:type II secretion system F family protein [Tenacibaculum sp. MAR_2009_124]SEC56503.1 type IV pilus assembly protein PilC [Tenacibaculum sp. MAR_2009_124]